MGYTKTELGTLDMGAAVYRYTLTNKNGVSASFTDLGGIWLTMLVPDREGRLADVVLGADRVPVLLNNPGHMGEPVGRNANRIAGGRFTLNGVTYVLAQNNGVNNLHSGLDYYRNRIYDTSVEETDGGTKITFSLFSPDGDQGYPGNAEVAVSYTLTEDNSVKIDYRMTADADTIANFTNHAYFNLAGHDSGDVLKQQLWLDADAFTPADETSIPTGEIRPVKGTPFDFTVMKPIGRDIHADYEQTKMTGGYDHNLCLNHEKGKLSLVARAWDEKSGRTMEVCTDLPAVQLYTANSLETDQGKGGASYGPYSGFCLETQYVPDAVNQPKFDSPVLKAGDTYASTTIYKFGVK